MPHASASRPPPSFDHPAPSPARLELSALEGHRAFLERTVARVCGEQDARDVVQEVFEAACRSYARFRGASSLRTWLYRIAINRAINHVEARTRRRRLVDEAAHVIERLAPSPHEGAVAADSERRVQRVLTLLPPPIRETVRARVINGMTLAKIAERDGVSIGTAHRRERIAKDRIAKTLGLA